MPRGRKLIGERAMTAAGRQQKRRNLVKENRPPMESEDRLGASCSGGFTSGHRSMQNLM
jgi:hypothetical protein